MLIDQAINTRVVPPPQQAFGLRSNKWLVSPHLGIENRENRRWSIGDFLLICQTLAGCDEESPGVFQIGNKHG